MKESSTETHHLFPSGEWEGFYTYRYGPSASRHPMSFFLNFSKHIVTGSGADSVGTFSWNGRYDTAQLTCKMTKSYHGAHTVDYDGNVDENGIWGTWDIRGFKGGFHIWPKKQNESSETAEVESKEKAKNKKKTLVVLK
jgi:hypothetical protein